MLNVNAFILRAPRLEDLDALLAIELEAFNTDRLSRKRMRHWIKATNRVFLVCVTDQDELAGYTLIFYRKNSNIARLYSIATSTKFRGYGLARALLIEGETLTAKSRLKRIQLEVREENSAAIALYRSLGYQQFATYSAFYEDGKDALRFQKQLT